MSVDPDKFIKGGDLSNHEETMRAMHDIGYATAFGVLTPDKHAGVPTQRFRIYYVSLHVKEYTATCADLAKLNPQKKFEHCHRLVLKVMETAKALTGEVIAEMRGNRMHLDDFLLPEGHPYLQTPRGIVSDDSPNCKRAKLDKSCRKWPGLHEQHYNKSGLVYKPWATNKLAHDYNDSMDFANLPEREKELLLFADEILPLDPEDTKECCFDLCPPNLLIVLIVNVMQGLEQLGCDFYWFHCPLCAPEAHNSSTAVTLRPT